ncbi:class I SAM-dependent DNA methyltransferase [Alkalibacillus salilacus]|uniref:SAM-dependent methyltransferase n=1 Tax=Alkalibacillus salilacus TaxID=284582 RepID=A0ABT9VCQ2_9BACI|nr:class I SAM-dependent methyltransferase [Alkalibacillus salilacus]MDQ0158689.1 SAM-dependent methyltransferase [Alkalibacillus salilacus]
MIYENMAYVYDELMDDAPYNQWVQFTQSLLGESSSHFSMKLLDLGCGTGTLTLSMTHLFDEIVGVDQSKTMIDVAKEKTQYADQKVAWIESDIRELRLEQSYDIITSYCDVVNYLTDYTSLEQMFDTVYQHLNPNGLFIFDSHSSSYVEGLIDAEMFTEIREDLSYVWLCEAGEQPGEITHDLTFFVEESNGLYRRFDETHTQRVFAVNEVRQLLESKGLSIKTITGDWGETDIENANRIFYVCQKTSI